MLINPNLIARFTRVVCWRELVRREYPE